MFNVIAYDNDIVYYHELVMVIDSVIGSVMINPRERSGSKEAQTPRQNCAYISKEPNKIVIIWRSIPAPDT